MPRQTIADRYELEQPLGGGAMSAVWLARDSELGRRVAVKLLAHDADRTRFEREARAVAALSHPNICQLYDYGETDEGPYMILEHLPGGTLEDRLAAGTPLPDAETARIAREVAAGLAHAHEHGLVHRDLKPSNILFDGEGRAKIADFGIARIAGAGVLTEAGTVLGTAAYISPEQATGEPATPASDVYSFGAILYRMLTGRTPFVSDSAMELVRMHRDEEPPPVERHREDAPAALAGVAFAALAKDPADRPADGDALLGELTTGPDAATTILAGAVPTAAPAAAAAPSSPATQVIRPRRGRRRRAGLLPFAIAGLVLALAGVAAAFVLTGGSGSGGSAPPPSLKLPTVGAGATASVSSAAPTTSDTQPTTQQTTTGSTTESTTTRKTTTQQTSTRQTSTQQTSTTTATTTAPPATTAPPPPTSTTIPATTTTPTETAPPTTTSAPPVTTTSTTVATA